MKKYFQLLILISTISFAQTKDYSKSSKEELINTINSKDKEIKSLKDRLETEKTAKEKLESQLHNSINSEIAILKKSIKETNAIFLREIFDNKYVNKPYLKDTDLAIEDIATRIENSNVLIKSILLDDTNKEVFDLCNKALNFNRNYMKLFEIRENVLNQKYDVKRVNTSLKEIEALPALETNSTLEIRKQKISNYLKNYLENTCLLKKTLDAYKRADQSAIMKQKYSALEKDEHYKDYPYLIKVIRKIKNSVIDYTNDDLEPCNEAKEKIIIIDEKQVKENEPTSTEKKANQ